MIRTFWTPSPHPRLTPGPRKRGEAADAGQEPHRGCNTTPIGSPSLKHFAASVERSRGWLSAVFMLIYMGLLIAFTRHAVWVLGPFLGWPS